MTISASGRGESAETPDCLYRGTETKGTPAGPQRLANPARVRPRERRNAHMSITTPRTTKADTLASLQALITGLQKQLPNGSFTLQTTAFTPQSLLTLIQPLTRPTEPL